ncbi:hypothetical protein [Actinomadura decatromicini]|uniref:Uncharacterized protein n=1 Tax=Actinomadura decatromicini TaxID=2604572 RepID=A0A5D3FR84_9ACTN|nr:hypothetical protein [Actinomadura decatromicini]TYK50851.1 hypothetical protein FXF68_10300 [Actinomadura decatromicini]
MEVVLVLLCLAIAGRELYLAFERRRSPGAPEIADIRTQLRELKRTREELDGVRAAQREGLDRLSREQDRDREALAAADVRIRSLIAQINERMVPDVNARLTRQREAVEALSAEVAGLRAHLARRLDDAVAASLGAEPADLVGGTLAVRPESARDALTGPYERFAAHHGLRVELTDGDRLYLSGRSPRALERDFIELVRALRGEFAEDTSEARALLDGLRDADHGGATLGPLLVVRTPESLVCGVLPLAELLRPDAARLLDDPPAAARRLRRLDERRFYDVPARSALNG